MSSIVDIKQASNKIQMITRNITTLYIFDVASKKKLFRN